MATKNAKPRKSFTRKVSTRQQKIDAINFIRSQCERKLKITDGFINKRFGVFYCLRRLIDNGVVVRVGKANALGTYSQSRLYTFHAGGITPADMVDMLWELHGRTDENGEPVERETKAQLVQSTIPMTVRVPETVEEPKTSRAEYNREWRKNNPEKMKEYNERVMAKRRGETVAPIEINDMVSIPSNAPVMNNGTASATLPESIEHWLGMVEQFGISARGEFIYAQLKTGGYVK